MTMTDTDQAIQRAVRTMMERFSTLPIDWAMLVAEHIDKDECVAMPATGLFKSEDSGMSSLISNLLGVGDIVPTDPVDIIAWAEEKGLDIEENELKLLALAASDDEDADLIESDIEAIRDGLWDQWRDEGSEECALLESGWQDVAGTGFIAREFDGHLCLGVNGGGYDFVEAHWTPLYHALGFTWHENEGA